MGKSHDLATAAAGFTFSGTVDASSGLTTPAGHIVQIAHTSNNQVDAHQSFNSTTLVGSGVTCSITPKSTSNKFIVDWNVSMAHYNSASQIYGVMKFKIGSGSYNFMTGVDDANNPYQVGYQYSGNQYSPMTMRGEVDITSADAYTFQPFYEGGSGLGHWCHIRASYSLLVMEIAQ